MDSEKYIHVYTDGACKGNPGKGGWGWVEYNYTPSSFTKIETTDYGGDISTTNNIMEMTAILEFLKHSQKGERYHIHSDSRYCLNVLIKGGVCGKIDTPGKYTGWMKGWLECDFKGKKNAELWREIHFHVQEHLKSKSVFLFEWVKGHSKNPGNDRADELANLGVPM